MKKKMRNEGILKYKKMNDNGCIKDFWKRFRKIGGNKISIVLVLLIKLHKVESLQNVSTGSISRETSFPSLMVSMKPSMKSLTPSVTPFFDRSNIPKSSDSPSNIPTMMTLIPTEIPSIIPSTYPTNIPSLVPSKIISSSPSLSTSNIPSLARSNIPSLMNSNLPSILFSENPSNLPTNNPSNTPSILRSQYPSIYSSNEPSISPTGLPSTFPSNLPTNYPSQFPSNLPTNDPSQFPSLLPTLLPSVRPSAMPSIQPSLSLLPTNDPSSQPSLMPSIHPTVLPSFEPTSIPSLFPSLTPTLLPSSLPSNIPSQRPSILPTSSPTLSLQRILIENIEMFFDDCNELDQTTIKTWKNVTENYLKNYVRDQDMIDLNIDIQFLSQCGNEQECFPSRRRMQISADPRNIYFDLIATFRSTIDHDFNTYIIEGLTNPNYIHSLQNSGVTTFFPTNKVDVKIQGYKPPPPSPTPSPIGVSPKEIAIISGSAAAALVVFALAGFVYIRREKRRLQRETILKPKLPKQRVTDVVHVTGTDDVSTIGDPIYPPGHSFGQQTYVDSDSLSGNYDYSVMYGGIGEMNSTSSSTGASTNVTGSYRSQTTSEKSYLRQESLFTEDASFDRQFLPDEDVHIEIRAPPGKLGMVVDAVDGDVPMVHAIRENSILMEKVRIGDKLISVDGEDTTGMTATEVSNLITQKIANHVRILVFSRNGRNVL